MSQLLGCRCYIIKFSVLVNLQQRSITIKHHHFSRATPSISHFFTLIETMIHPTFIPALTGLDAPNDMVRSLLALPTRCGGLGNDNSVSLALTQFDASVAITTPLVTQIIKQDHNYTLQIQADQLERKTGQTI